uniref:(California timema) hypothetical protein n=1 Tax=Timema californicum TaxID=61474 RepID=A0A7R9IY65_TIMCA|nr:unnamed protein product [Timema californicum]
MIVKLQERSLLKQKASLDPCVIQHSPQLGQKRFSFLLEELSYTNIINDVLAENAKKEYLHFCNLKKSQLQEILCPCDQFRDEGSLQCSLCYQNGSLTPEKKSRSRPPSFVGDSPVNPRSRSSTSDSLKSGSSPNSSYRPVPPPPPPQNRKPSSDFQGLRCTSVCDKIRQDNNYCSPLPRKP